MSASNQPACRCPKAQACNARRSPHSSADSCDDQSCCCWTADVICEQILHVGSDGMDLAGRGQWQMARGSQRTLGLHEQRSQGYQACVTFRHMPGPSCTGAGCRHSMRHRKDSMVKLRTETVQLYQPVDCMPGQAQAMLNGAHTIGHVRISGKHGTHLRPRQVGQPLPGKCRLLMAAIQRCTEPSADMCCHVTRLSLPGEYCSGVPMAALASWSHCAARSGLMACSELQGHTWSPLQKGQPDWC